MKHRILNVFNKINITRSLNLIE